MGQSAHPHWPNPTQLSGKESINQSINTDTRTVSNYEALKIIRQTNNHSKALKATIQLANLGIAQKKKKKKRTLTESVTQPPTGLPPGAM